MLNVCLSNQRPIDELLVSGSSGEDASALETRDNWRHCCLRQLSLGVQLLPDLSYRQFALFPEKAKDGDLELGELLAVGHLVLLVSTHVDSTLVERGVKRKVSDARNSTCIWR